MLSALLKLAATQGVQKVSLSVETDNPATRLYQAHGFEIVAQVDNAWTMVAHL